MVGKCVLHEEVNFAGLLVLDCRTCGIRAGTSEFHMDLRSLFAMGIYAYVIVLMLGGYLTNQEDQHA